MATYEFESLAELATFLRQRQMEAKLAPARLKRDAQANADTATGYGMAALIVEQSIIKPVRMQDAPEWINGTHTNELR